MMLVIEMLINQSLIPFDCAVSYVHTQVLVSVFKLIFTIFTSVIDILINISASPRAIYFVQYHFQNEIGYMADSMADRPRVVNLSSDD